MLEKITAQIIICATLTTIAFAVKTDAVENVTTKKIVVAQDDRYHPEVIYRGDYVSSELYYRERSTQPWMRRAGSTDNYSDTIKCSTALKSLSSDGRWLGNLNLDGSCGTLAEPSTFVLGNRLNYEDASKSQ